MVLIGCLGGGYVKLKIQGVWVLKVCVLSILLCLVSNYFVVFPGSLVAKVLKARYYPRCSIMEASLGCNSSYTCTAYGHLRMYYSKEVTGVWVLVLIYVMSMLFFSLLVGVCGFIEIKRFGIRLFLHLSTLHSLQSNI